MEYWEVSKKRADISLPIWRKHTPGLHMGILGSADLQARIDGFEPLLQARVAAQDDLDAAERKLARTLQIMKTLSIKVPAIIEAQLSENDGIVAAVNDLQAVAPKAEGTILKRAQMLYPAWVRADAALAALTPAQPAIARVIEGTAYTAALLKDLLDGFANVVQERQEMKSALKRKQAELRTHHRATDKLVKRWYKHAKALAEEGSDLESALEAVPKEPGASATKPARITKLKADAVEESPGAAVMLAAAA